jgi:ferritin
MNLNELVDLLNEDLSREYSHWHFYMTNSASVSGLHREEISEFLFKEAQGEMNHVNEFNKLLHGIINRRKLNKTISISVASFRDNISCPLEILEEALKMEEEVVRNYVQRIKDASSLQENGGEDEIDGKFIELFLEDQMADSRSDADEIRMMIKKI